jgi:hypothetical protein
VSSVVTTVTGQVSLMLLTNASCPPIPLPVLITVAKRGEGFVQFNDAIFNGQDVTGYWNANEPMGIIGTGSFQPSPDAVEANSSGIHWFLDGATRHLEAGHYHVAVAVAVAVSGLATAEYPFDFESNGSTTLVSEGKAELTKQPMADTFSGPGSVVLQGSLTVSQGGAPKSASAVSFGPGPYSISITPDSGGYQIQATLHGLVATSGS